MGILDLFEDESKVVEFAKGDYVFRQGDEGHEMFVILHGEVDILVNGASLEVAREGSMVGEMALIEDRPRSASVLVQSDCRLVAINERRFQYLVQKTPYFALRVMKVMADRLRRMNERFPAEK